MSESEQATIGLLGFTGVYYESRYLPLRGLLDQPHTPYILQFPGIKKCLSINSDHLRRARHKHLQHWREGAPYETTH